jgi:hypothetical protein
MATVRETLDNLEKELLDSVSALRAALAPLERELASVRRAKAALPAEVDLDEAEVPLFEDRGARQDPKEVFSPVEYSPYARLTMKELTIKALSEQFPGGAEANELLDFLHKAWGRTDIVRSSLSPQLSRLKKEGDIDLVGRKWVLVF